MPSLPVFANVEQPVGLFGFLEQPASSAKFLAFNLDDYHCTDLCTDLVVLPGTKGPVTGLPGYLEGVKAGKAVVFNLDEIVCLDMCRG